MTSPFQQFKAEMAATQQKAAAHGQLVVQGTATGQVKSSSQPLDEIGFWNERTEQAIKQAAVDELDDIRQLFNLSYLGQTEKLAAFDPWYAGLLQDAEVEYCFNAGAASVTG